jgi:hypothetical protein
LPDQIFVWLDASVLITSDASGQDAAVLYRQDVDLQQKGDLAGAADAYRKSLALDGSNVAAHSSPRAALSGLSRFEEAIPCQTMRKAVPSCSPAAGFPWKHNWISKPGTAFRFCR